MLFHSAGWAAYVANVVRCPIALGGWSADPPVSDFSCVVGDVSRVPFLHKTQLKRCEIRPYGVYELVKMVTMQSVFIATVHQSQCLPLRAVTWCSWSRASRWSMCREFDIVALKSFRWFMSGGNTSNRASHSLYWSTDTLSNTTNWGASMTLSELPSSYGSTCIPWVMMWHLVALLSKSLSPSSLVVVVQVLFSEHWNVTSCISGKWYTNMAPWRSKLGVVWSNNSCRWHRLCTSFFWKSKLDLQVIICELWKPTQ